MKSFVLFFWGLLVSFSSFSQFTISGTIFDNNGNPLPGASITVDSTYLGVISNANGQYKLKLKKGKYSLSVSFIGYKTEHKTIVLQNDLTLNFSLQQDAFLADEVIISAQQLQHNTPIAHNTINKKDLEKKNTGKDLPIMLSSLPSIVTTSDAGMGVGYTGMRIRGIGIRGINVTINGIPLNDPESQGVWWVDVPDLAAASNNIQIQRGVGSSTNGSGAFGATINIQTMTPQNKAYAEIHSDAGSYNTFHNNVKFGTGLIDDHFSFDGNFSKITSDGFIDRAFSNMKSMDLSGTYYGKNSLLKFVVLNGQEKTYQAWFGVPKDSLENSRTFNPYTYDNETDNYRQSHYQLHYTKKITKNLYLTSSAFYIYGEGYYENYKQNKKLSKYLMPNIIVGNDTIEKSDLITRKWLSNDYYGSNLSLHYQKKALNIIGGGGYYYYDGRHFGKIIWAQYAGNTPIRHEWYRGTGLKKDANTFVKASYLFNNFNFYIDLQERFIDYTINGIHDDLSTLDNTPHRYSFLNPKAGINYSVNESNNISVYYGISHREPTRSMFVDADAGHTPLPEQLNDLEIGYHFNNPKLKASFNLYDMHYHNQLIMTGEINNVGTPIYTNVATSYRQGIELEIAYRPFKMLTWQSNATFSRNKIENFSEYVDNWDYWYDPEHEPYQYTNTLGTTDISFSPSIIAFSQLTFTPTKGLSLSIDGKYVSRQYIDNTSSVERSLDPYFVSNLNLSYSFSTKWIQNITIHATAYNIFNEDYETNAWVYRYKSGDGSFDGSYGDIYSTPDKAGNGFYNMIGYFPQAPLHFMGGISLKF